MLKIYQYFCETKVVPAHPTLIQEIGLFKSARIVSHTVHLTQTHPQGAYCLSAWGILVVDIVKDPLRSTLEGTFEEHGHGGLSHSSI